MDETIAQRWWTACFLVIVLFAWSAGLSQTLRIKRVLSEFSCLDSDFVEPYSVLGPHLQKTSRIIYLAHSSSKMNDFFTAQYAVAPAVLGYLSEKSVVDILSQYEATASGTSTEALDLTLILDFEDEAMLRETSRQITSEAQKRGLKVVQSDVHQQLVLLRVLGEI